MSQIGMSQTRLDEIELRLIGADHAPWLFDSRWRAVTKDARKARRKAFQAAMADAEQRTGRSQEGIPGDEPCIDARVMQRELVLFSLENDATNDMGQFVAHAPADVRDLVDEVKFLRIRLEKAEATRDEFKKEMLALRIDSAALQQKLTETRAAWRKLNEVMK